jgi:hypothetical protein
MGQHHQVEAGGGKGQRGVVGFDLHPPLPAVKRKGMRLARRKSNSGAPSCTAL